jgi:hypothetical protein
LAFSSAAAAAAAVAAAEKATDALGCGGPLTSSPAASRSCFIAAISSSLGSEEIFDTQTIDPCAMPFCAQVLLMSMSPRGKSGVLPFGIE